MQWDIFCQVIDNFGDIGVCWRLACNLATQAQQVRLWTDDASALVWMAPAQGHTNIQVRAWGSGLLPSDAPSDVLVEAFGCEIDTPFIAQVAAQTQRNGHAPPVWINLEYLSAEHYVERCHRLPSPVQHGPASGWTKWFFYPGFTSATGGLLREPDLLQRQACFDRAAWRQAHTPQQGLPAPARWISLFCYEPAGLPALLTQCQQSAPSHTHLLLTPGRATTAVQSALATSACPASGQLTLTTLAPVTQPAFDEMLWACDLNLVRGEDSLVRALWAGQPLVWHIYPQHDNAHHAKLHAFLDWLHAPPSLRQFHAVWNGLIDAPLPTITTALLEEWAACVQAARKQLLQQEDLLTQLLGFCTAQR
ncbi:MULTISPECIES: elongation factor P maturation arginine rhamnosyltransferase EarP [Giesbergeria]|uniref:Protein-arginine rhamnosyltransferase n=1 Tax=Giesbergeria sinuosa TaxID=80883 RepID=A0ABV9Q9V6_9BURK